MPVRLQKYLADAGVASRRGGEELIRAGRVTVNGAVVSTLGAKVDPARDEVGLDGRTLRARRLQYVALHKPAGYVCTRSDPQRRDVVGDLLPREWRGLYPVGRLDRDSEGLLFLTNDGEFCLRLTHPRYGVCKKYLATVSGKVDRPLAARLVHGVRHAGDRLRAVEARILSANQSRSVVELKLAEGRKHEVRRLFESQGLTVERLVRTQIGPVKLGELPAGKWRVLSPAELRSLCPEWFDREADRTSNR